MKKDFENQTPENSQVRLTRREFLKAAAAAGLALSLPRFLCGGTYKVAAASGPRRLIVGQGVDLESWDPYGHSSTVGYSIWQHFMEPLLRFDFETKRFRPVLAESWTNENGTDWVFKIRRGGPLHGRFRAYSCRRGVFAGEGDGRLATGAHVERRS
jgi:hypothetical protein